jgi:hypothetical protein
MQALTPAILLVFVRILPGSQNFCEAYCSGRELVTGHWCPEHLGMVAE